MRSIAYVVSLFALTMVLGCGSSAENTESHDDDHHENPITEADVDMPANYADAIVRIAEYRDAIRSAIASGDAEAAHRPLDELEIVLDKLPEIARASDVEAEHWETVNLNARQLREAFDKLHLAIDEHKSPDYSAVSAEIEQALTQLEQVPQ